MNEPLVSIIVPAYNRSQIIGETLDSVMGQTYSQWECIIVDDGSTDDTADVVQNYTDKDARFQWAVRASDRPKGANACRNLGIQLAKGSYAIFLDSDDLLKNNCLEHRVAIFEKQTEFNFLAFRMGAYDGSKFSEATKVAANSHEGIVKQFIRQEYAWNITGPIWKRSFLNDFHFDERLYRYQDVELHLRVLLSSEAGSYKVFQETDCFYRVNERTQLIHIDDTFKKNIVKSYHLLIESVKKHATDGALESLRKEIVFGYYRMLSKYLNTATKKIFAKGKQTIYGTVEVTPKEKLYFYVLTQLILRLKGKKGFFSVKAPIKGYFENL